MSNAVALECESISMALPNVVVQAGSIARGLENAAPSASSSATGSVHYLHAVAAHLAMEGGELLQGRLPRDGVQTYQDLLVTVRRIIQQDIDLREKYQVGGRFRFVSDRLQALLPSLEEHVLAEKATVLVQQSVSRGETFVGQPVYVYLYNAQGTILRTWAALLTPRAFYEYSVSRPVYREKKDIEGVIAQKPDRVQHAYLTVVVNPDVISDSGSGIRVKEGSLQIERLQVFTHNNQDYVFQSGELIKKM